MRLVPDQTSLRSEQVLLEEAQARVGRAVRELSAHTDRPSAAIETLVLDSPKPPLFRFAHVYQVIAKRAGYAISSGVRQGRYGYEHSVLLVRTSTPESLVPVVMDGLKHAGSSRSMEQAGVY